MISAQTTYLLFFGSNPAFIVTNLYGWLLKWFYRPKAYGEHFHELFPAHREVGLVYLLQVLEVPYLLQIGNPDALLYANAFALLGFSLQMLVMCEYYFFPHGRHSLKDFWFAVPVVVVLVPLFLQATGVVSFPTGWRRWAFVVVTFVFAGLFGLNIHMAQKIGDAIRQVNENVYADSDDFPVRFAQYIQWLPTVICVLLAFNFYADDPWVKCVRDLLFIGADVTFCIYTLNPWRKIFTVAEEQLLESSRLGPARLEELSHRLELLLTDERIFTRQHITIDTLVSQLGINSKYLTEVIHRSGYLSFYDMICQHRVRHAMSLIQKDPSARLADVAERCGFSSQASMTKAFTSQGKPSPSSFRRSVEE